MLVMKNRQCKFLFNNHNNSKIFHLVCVETFLGSTYKKNRNKKE